MSLLQFHMHYIYVNNILTHAVQCPPRRHSRIFVQCTVIISYNTVNVNTLSVCWKCSLNCMRKKWIPSEKTDTEYAAVCCKVADADSGNLLCVITRERVRLAVDVLRKESMWGFYTCTVYTVRGMCSAVLSGYEKINTYVDNRCLVSSMYDLVLNIFALSANTYNKINTFSIEFQHPFTPASGHVNLA